MGLTGQEERACVHDSMRMGWGRGGGDDGGCHGRYITAAAKLMHPSMRSAHTLYSLFLSLSLSLSLTPTQICIYIF